MADQNVNDKTETQESLKKQHRQGSLHPSDSDMLTGSVSGKGYSQDHLDLAEQSRLSLEQTGGSEKKSLLGELEKKKSIAPVVIVIGRIFNPPFFIYNR